MSDDFLDARKKALENSFFAKENARLLDELRAKQDRAQAVAALTEASGLSDAELVGRLVDLGLAPDAWAAISLVPLVEVAWADGKMEAKERAAVLEAASSHGVAPGSASHQLLTSWLEERPASGLIEAWAEYIVGLVGKLGAGERQALRERVLGRAEAVAKSAGGILGLGAVSAPEEAMLNQLARAFDIGESAS